MFFFLDHDVDAGVGRVLRRAGHRCVSASEVGLATASDDEVSVFADNHKAVMLTHDRELITRRRERTFGRHVHLDFPDTDAVEVVERRLEELLPKLEERDSLVVHMPKNGEIAVYPSSWK